MKRNLKGKKQQKKKGFFVNCCFISVEKEIGFSTELLFNAVKNEFGEELLKSLFQIGKFFNAQNCSIQFKDRAAFDSAAGKHINIGFAIYVRNIAKIYRAVVEGWQHKKFEKCVNKLFPVKGLGSGIIWNNCFIRIYNQFVGFKP